MRIVDKMDFLDADKIEIQVQEIDTESMRAGIAKFEARNAGIADDDDQSVRESERDLLDLKCSK